ncbi:type IV pilin protein [Vogesella sp. LIG4]|uniref:type IV pilin protein n=1 Tax=Vogesella sp. LIG4 TaxID=1192162 RepID=UPI00081FF602|nr:type IV pilin protein [Vogesella sp. LIG4]SCK18864.1 type IV pilus assembly protein PilE [Vogesella sp. LIG4]
MHKTQQGFTLIELVVVMVVAAILATIAIPAYSQYIQKSRRIDAKNALTAVQLAQEKYRGNNTAYSSSQASLGLTSSSPQGYYTISITTATSSTYAALAVINASSAQAKDSCNNLTINQDGFPSSNDSCWGLQ